MNLQISIPKQFECVNKCPFCISKTHNTTIDKQFETLSLLDYADKLDELLSYGLYKTVVITGENEPLQQEGYVWAVLKVLEKYPHISVELITTGTLFDKYLKSDRPMVKTLNRIDVVSLSTLGSAKCDTQVIKKKGTDFKKLAKLIKKKMQNTLVRATILESIFISYEDFDKVVSNKHIDQITIKHLQGENPWINKHKSKRITDYLNRYFASAKKTENDRFAIYEINNKSIFVDKNCQTPSEGGYHVMRSDGNIYNGWQTTKKIN